MAGNIWVIAEHFRGEVSEITYEILALGRELADALGVKLEVVLAGDSVRPLAGCLGKADNVLLIENPALAAGDPQTCAKAVAQAAGARQPGAVLVGLTNVTMGLGSLLSAELGTPAVNFSTGAKVEDGKIVAHCVMYGGKIEADVVSAEAPAVLCLWPGSRSPEKGRGAGAPSIEDCAVDLSAPAIEFKRYIEPEADNVDITRLDALVAVGRGIQSKDNVELAEELAEALGGAVCGSRPVIDQGWLALSRQVGKSGVTVKPKLYIAAGISGAPEHVEGMRDADLIIAVNSDAQAPIFNVADIGIVGDAADVLPALTEAVRARKG
jgi:electron transfer flavoprotein alpha subunit